MSDHDPLCIYQGDGYGDSCEICRSIAEARANERSRIAAAIEALNVSPNAAGDYQRGWEIVRGIAARIARQGGRDE